MSLKANQKPEVHSSTFQPWKLTDGTSVLIREQQKSVSLLIGRHSASVDHVAFWFSEFSNLVIFCHKAVS